MEAGGNLVFHNPDGSVRWSTGTSVAGSMLYLMNDGNLCIFDTSGNVVWSSFSTPGIEGFGEPFIPPLTRGFNPRFGGTYSILLSADHWDQPDDEHTVTFMVRQCEFLHDTRSNVTQVSRTFTPSVDAINGLIEIDTMTIPERVLPPEATAPFYKMRLGSDHPLDVWDSVMFLDTQGSTIIVNVQTGDSYAQMFMDEPTAEVDIGIVSGSRTDRSAAVGIFDQAWVSGPPLMVEPGDNLLMVYSHDGPPAALATYSPRWMVDSSEDS
jgi:hypothetical protein